jgi:hypothetical protein
MNLTIDLDNISYKNNSKNKNLKSPLFNLNHSSDELDEFDRFEGGHPDNK